MTDLGDMMGLPDLELRGEGTVTAGGKPAKTRAQRKDYHKALFLERGISEAEAERLAEAVVARDDTSGHPPLELHPDEAARLAAERDR